MKEDEDQDTPDSGAVYTFGKSRFADNVPGIFWVKDDPVIQIACGDEHTVFITGSGRVFSFGSNEWGQLGHGHTKIVLKPTSVKSLKEERVVVVACGRAHSLVATDRLNTYAFGINTESQLGITNSASFSAEPVMVEALRGCLIKQLSAGSEHSAALTDKGVLFIWGGNSEGQLGIPEREGINIPVQLKLEFSAMSVSLGYYHSALISVDGILYTFGETDGGKLGLPDNLLKKSNRPQQVPGIPKKIIEVACGGTHTIVLTADGSVYSFGDGSNGQLGLGTKILQTSLPHSVDFSEGIKIAEISCGENHSAFLSDKGQVYTCGDGRHGKLAALLDDNFSNLFVPTLVQHFLHRQVQQVTCGGCHTLVLLGGLSQNDNTDSNIAKNIFPSARYRRRSKRLIIYNSEGSDFESSATESANPFGDSVHSNCLKLYKDRQFLLQNTDDNSSLRFVDSDVDSVTSEISSLNKTQTVNSQENLNSVINTQEQITSAAASNDASGESKSLDISKDENGSEISSHQIVRTEHTEKDSQDPDESSVQEKKSSTTTWYITTDNQLVDDSLNENVSNKEVRVSSAFGRLFSKYKKKNNPENDQERERKVSKSQKDMEKRNKINSSACSLL